MSKYYRANDEIAAKVRALFAEEEAAKEAGLKISRRVGGSRTQLYTARDIYGNLGIVGLRFNAAPDPKHWIQLKGMRDAWRPCKSTKQGKKLAKELADLKCRLFPSVTKAIGMECWKGLNVTIPGLKVIDEVVYLHLPDNITPPEDCVRVSDVDYERLSA